MKNLEQVRKELNAKLPRDMIREREAFGGFKLSYIEGWQAIDLLNQILGQGNWGYEIGALIKTADTKIVDKKGREGRGVSYNATVLLTVHYPDHHTVRYSDVGSGKGLDYGTGLEADESAAKEAVTDALKRCAKSLGMALGLALYDRSGENIDESSADTKALPVPSSQVPKKGAPAQNAAPQVEAPVSPDTKALEKAVRSKFRLLTEMKLITNLEFQKRLKERYTVDKLADCNAEQMAEVLAELESIGGET